ncbi:MAG: hypothetical protein DIU68_016885 [Chloroflexota bacterium]|nr:MAG: hypothetical protein DIU68_09725 [Chloroflexota bacterium]
MRRRVLLLFPLLIVLVTACNLTAITAPTPTPFPTPVPLGEAQSPGVIFVTATPFGDPLPDGITPVPVATLSPGVTAPTSNAVEWLVQTVVIPAWNFLYDLFFQALGSLWLFAGARGGVFAQVVCCVGPAILLAVAGVRYVLRGRGVD